MSDELPGSHHCIAIARTVADVVFRTLRAQCSASGGNLSLEDLERYYSQILYSFSSGVDLFELRHHNCMGVSLGIAEMPLARSKILATLLRACGEQSARAAFALQVKLLGTEWIGQFFASLAEYVRQHVHSNIDGRLINAYVETAMIPKMKLTIRELLNQEAIKGALIDCVTTFETPGEPESMVKEVRDWVNHSIASKRTVGGPHPCKVTEDETRRFITLLPRQLRATLNMMPADDTSAEQSIPVV
jgi:hypothetical protein